MHIYIGIDPGQSGAICSVNDDGRIVRATKMPLTPAEIFEELGTYEMLGRGEEGALEAHNVYAVLENQNSFAPKGVRFNTSAMAGFFRHLGHLEAFLLASGIKYDLKMAAHWQRAMGCLTGGNKNITKARAEQLFSGSVKVTHALADALLLAEYCRRTQRGIPLNKE
jgi:hypothetical protein